MAILSDTLEVQEILVCRSETEGVVGPSRVWITLRKPCLAILRALGPLKA